MKHPHSDASFPAAAILAGGLLFSGPAASAAVLLTENWEGASNVFSTPTYNYTSQFTLPNGLTPPGGLVYGNGGQGTNGSVSTNSYPVSAISLTAGTGVSASQIDAGFASYAFRGQFSSYLTQGDWTQLSITFLDAASTPIGSPILLGGDAFTQALPTAAFGNYSDAKAWGESAATGTVPTGARSIGVTLSMTKVAGGTAIDGYVDNISLNISAVPEPDTLTLSGIAGLALLRRRRR